jgi:hypothetical protein
MDVSLVDQSDIELVKSIRRYKINSADSEKLSLSYYFLAKSLFLSKIDSNAKKAMIYILQSLKYAKGLNRAKKRKTLFKKIAIMTTECNAYNEKHFLYGLKILLGYKYFLYRKNKTYKDVNKSKILFENVDNYISGCMAKNFKNSSKDKTLVLIDAQFPVRFLKNVFHITGSSDFLPDTGVRVAALSQYENCRIISFKDIIPISSPFDLDIANRSIDLALTAKENLVEIFNSGNDPLINGVLESCSYELQDCAYNAVRIYESVKKLLSNKEYSNIVYLCADGGVSQLAKSLVVTEGYVVTESSINIGVECQIIKNVYRDLLTDISNYNYNHEYFKRVCSNVEYKEYKDDTLQIKDKFNFLEGLGNYFSLNRPVIVLTTTVNPIYFSNSVELIKELIQNFNVILILSGRPSKDNRKTLSDFSEGLYLIDTQSLASSHELVDYRSFCINKWNKYLRTYTEKDSLYGGEIDVLSKGGRLHSIFSRAFPLYLAVQNIYADILDMFDVAAFIGSPDRISIARLGVDVFKKNGIDTFFVQGCFQSLHPRYKKPSCEHVIVMDSLSEKIFKKGFSLSDDEVVCLGAPRMDRLSAVSDSEEATLVSDELLNKKVLLIATQHFSLEDNVYHVEALSKAVKKLENKDAYLLVKIHPSEPTINDQRYVEICQKYLESHQFCVKRDGDILSLLAASEIVITGYSNVGLESAIKRTPVMLVNLTGTTYPFPIEEMGFSPMVYTEDGVIQFVDDFFNSDGFKNKLLSDIEVFISRHPFLEKGDSSLRISNYIKEIYQKRKAL